MLKVDKQIIRNPIVDVIIGTTIFLIQIKRTKFTDKVLQINTRNIFQSTDFCLINCICTKDLPAANNIHIFGEFAFLMVAGTLNFVLMMTVGLSALKDVVWPVTFTSWS